MEISRELCNREIDKIIKIDGGIGDTHCRGRQVLKLTLDTGEQLLYKPHSLRNEGGKVWDAMERRFQLIRIIWNLEYVQDVKRFAF